MPYMTSIERIRAKKDIVKDFAKESRKGIEKGIEKGRQEGDGGRLAGRHPELLAHKFKKVPAEHRPKVRWVRNRASEQPLLAANDAETLDEFLSLL